MKSAISTVPLMDLRETLHRHIHYTETERAPWKLHASDITKQDKQFCGRAAVISRKINRPLRTVDINTHDAVTWEWGRMCETRVRDWLAEIGMLVGDWQCDHYPCKRIYEWQKRPTACPNCYGRRFNYLESRALSEFSGMSCGLDILTNRGGAKLRLTEVKSMDKDIFKKLAAPLAEHRIRTSAYLRAIAESNNPLYANIDTSEADIIYVTKGGYGCVTPEMEDWVKFSDGKFSPFKPYTIQRQDETTQPYVEASRETFLALHHDGPVPARICSSQACQRAHTCAVETPTVAKACWAAKEW